MSFFSSLADAARRPFAVEPSTGRRQFFRRAAGVGAAAVASGLMLPDEAWAGIDARAAAHGVATRGLVDATGTPMDPVRGQANPILGQLMTVGFNFAPRGWAFCDGQILPINQYTALFSLLGTTFGGDGRTTFALPDLRGRRAIEPGRGPGLSDYRWGERGGTETSQLTVANLPSHNHAETASTTTANQAIPFGRAPAPTTVGAIYADAAAGRQNMAPTGNTGGSQSFSNLPPFLGLYTCIAMQGIFPSRS